MRPPQGAVFFMYRQLHALTDDSQGGACYNDTVLTRMSGRRAAMDALAMLWVLGLLVAFFGLSLARV